MRRNRGELRRLKDKKLKQRERLLKAYGFNQGSLFEKHRKKIEKSTGYMSSGNISHYINTYPSINVRDRDRHGKVTCWSPADQKKIDSCQQQIKDYNGEC